MSQEEPWEEDEGQEDEAEEKAGPAVGWKLMLNKRYETKKVKKRFLHTQLARRRVRRHGDIVVTILLLVCFWRRALWHGHVVIIFTEISGAGR